jgi:CheY-like chemotaxis protein
MESEISDNVPDTELEEQAAAPDLSDENQRLREELDALRRQLQDVQPDKPDRPAESPAGADQGTLGLPFKERTRSAIIIDDSRLIHIRYRSIIESYGISVVATAQDGSLGAGLVQSNSPRLVVLDYNMPGINGTECTKQIREIDNQTKIIIVSAQLDGAKIGMLKAAGANDFLVKPINEQKFRESISRLGI